MFGRKLKKKRVVKKLENNKFCSEGISFKYEVIFSQRKSISVEVHNAGLVKVRTPLGTSSKFIENELQHNLEWIRAKLSKASNTKKLSIEGNFENGDELLFLGKELTLSVEEDLVNKIHLENNRLVASMIRPESDKLQKMIKNWYRDQSEEIFHQRLEICKENAAIEGIFYDGDIRLYKMKQKWGSCSSDGQITLNTELIKTPIDCIDYVICHELCHLKEFNHSKRFYNLQSKILSDWKQRKHRLNNDYSL